MPSLSKPLPELLGATPNTRLDWQYVNRLLVELQSRIAELQILKEGLEGAIAQAESIALARVEEIIGPAQEAMNAAVAAAGEALADLQEAASTAVDGIVADAEAAIAQAVSDATSAVETANAAAQAALAAAAAAQRQIVLTSGNVNATAGQRIYCDTSAGAVTVTLPTEPEANATIAVRRIGANDVVIARNGETIAGAAEDLTIDTDMRGVTLEFTGATWRALPEIFA